MFSLQRQEKATEDSWGGHCQCPVLGTCEICSSQVQVINSSNSREDTKGPRAVCLLSELGVPSALVDWIVPWMVACAESLGSSVKQRPIKIAASGQQVTDQGQAESKQTTRQIAGVQVEDEETFSYQKYSRKGYWKSFRERGLFQIRLTGSEAQGNARAGNRTRCFLVR